jgi:hypothetical protein
MTQRAQVERNAATGRDRNNQPVAADWQPHVAVLVPGETSGRMPCFLWPERERMVEGGVNARVANVMIGVPQDADVSPADRINGIYDRLGAVLDPHVYRILGDERMGRSHRELTLEAVTGAAGAAG